MGRILVTGAQGYVGRYTVSALLDADQSVLGIGRSPKCNDHFSHHFVFQGQKVPAPLPPELRTQLADDDQYTYRRCDLADAEAVCKLVRDERPSLIIHLAGALRDEVWKNLFTSNLLATLNVMSASGELEEAPLIILGSTGSVYGNQIALPIDESAVPVPIGSYATSKWMSELMAVDIARDRGMPLVIARIFNIVGPGLQPRHFAGYLSHRIAEIEKSALDPTIAIGDLGTIRDYVDVRDVARFFAANFDRQAAITLVNVAGGQETATSTIANLLSGLSNAPLEFRSNPARTRDGADRVHANSEKFKRYHHPQFTLHRSLDDMLEYARMAIS